MRLIATLGLLLLFNHVIAGTCKAIDLPSIKFRSRNIIPKEIPGKLFQLNQKLSQEMAGPGKRKIIAAILSFPVPFGVFGSHRLYLGAKPIIPIVYLVTFGGGFGILPFVDFTVMLLSEDLKPYEGNSKLFMWNMEKP